MRDVADPLLVEPVPPPRTDQIDGGRDERDGSCRVKIDATVDCGAAYLLVFTCGTGVKAEGIGTWTPKLSLGAATVMLENEHCTHERRGAGGRGGGSRGSDSFPKDKKSFPESPPLILF